MEEQSQVGEARRAAARLGAAAALDRIQAGRLAIVVTEAANNLVQHTRGGQIVLRVIRDGDGGNAVEVLALDRGPGIANVEACLRDGYSTGGTAGEGLGAIRRLSCDFDVYSVPEQGTGVLARVRASERAKCVERGPEYRVGAVCLPIPTETACGDAWRVQSAGARILVTLVDGLGHGPNAAAAAAEAVRVFSAQSEKSPGQILEAAHAALRSTCGAVMGVAEIRPDLQQLCFAGVGNISGQISSGESSVHLVSHSGIVGNQMRKIQEFVYPWSPERLLLLHSDGLGTLRSRNRYPGLWRRDPSLVAGILYRDGLRGNDDVTVLAVRQAAQTSGREALA